MREKNLKITYIIMVVTLVIVAFLILAQVAYGQETPGGCDPRHKEWICHVPPGDPANVHSICIDQSAWEDPHEKHGDSKGTCPDPTITCSDAYVTGDHTLSMDVTSTGREFTGPVVIFTQGPVTMDIGTCALEGDLKDSCTWSATGDPTYQGDQSVLVRFTQRDHYGEIMNEVECLMTGAGGLPVELLEFGVE